MYTYQLVAALVLRKGDSSASMRPMTWGELGEVFDVTKDVARHRINKFKEKYNIVSSDIVDGWNVEFMREHTPSSEQLLIDLDGRNVPGDITGYGIIIGPNGETVSLNANDELQFVNSNVTKDEAAVITVLSQHLQESEPKTMTPLQYLITPMVLVVVRDGQPLTIDKSHKNFDKIQASLSTGEWQKVLDFIDMKSTLSKYSNGRVTVDGSVVSLDGTLVHGKLSDRLVDCLLEENVAGLDGLSNFMQKCDENPDYRVVTRIYDFIAHNDLRLDKDGNVLAYKIVQSGYKDKYTGTMDNSPGKIVKLKRNQVNPVDSQTCSFGLHVASKSYLPSYGSVANGDRVLLCQVNPKDFVSIPTDLT
jgi:hypothetical protein